MNNPDTSPDVKCIYQDNELQKAIVLWEKTGKTKGCVEGASGPYIMRAEGVPPLWTAPALARAGKSRTRKA